MSASADLRRSARATIDEVAEALKREKQARPPGLDDRVHDQMVGRKEGRAGQETLPLIDWSLQVPEPKTGVLDFKRFPFQPEMYRIMGSAARDVVVRKATQVGISAMAIRWALYECDRNSRTVLYVFPTEKAVYDLSDARIGPLFECDYLRARAGEPFNKGMKRVGRGFCYFRGSENKRGLDSVDADGLVLDEFDTLNQANIPDAERRLSGVTSAGLIRRVGVPSLPEFGIAERFDESDRRKWLVRCEGCRSNGEDRENGEPLVTIGRQKGWQELSYWKNVDEKNLAVVCEWCREPLDVGAGTWVAQQPDGLWPGFHVSRLIVPNMPLEGIVRASKKMTPDEVEVFHNKDLGLPFISKESRLSPADIVAAQSASESRFGQPYAMVSGYAGDNFVTMGIDVASERALNVRVSEHFGDELKRALWIGEVDDPGELVQLMHRYRVTMAVIDAAPEGRLAKAFVAEFPGRSYRVRYAQQLEPLAVDDEMQIASAQRTTLIDATVEKVKQLRNLLPVDLPAGYVQHMTANVRRRVVRPDGVTKVAVWVATRPDDYMQAEVYDVLAAELMWRRFAIDDMQRETLTPLDDLMPFQRSHVDDLSETGWEEGPAEDDDFTDPDAMYGID